MRMYTYTGLCIYVDMYIYSIYMYTCTHIYIYITGEDAAPAEEEAPAASSTSASNNALLDFSKEKEGCVSFFVLFACLCVYVFCFMCVCFLFFLSLCVRFLIERRRGACHFFLVCMFRV